MGQVIQGGVQLGLRSRIGLRRLQALRVVLLDLFSDAVDLRDGRADLPVQLLGSAGERVGQAIHRTGEALGAAEHGLLGRGVVGRHAPGGKGAEEIVEGRWQAAGSRDIEKTLDRAGRLGLRGVHTQGLRLLLDLLFGVVVAGILQALRRHPARQSPGYHQRLGSQNQTLSSVTGR